MNDPNHPLWNLLRFALVCAVVAAVIIFSNARNVDAGEWTEVILIVLSMLGFRGWEVRQQAKGH